MCETFNKEYDISLKKRENEVQLVDSLLKLIESKRKELNEGAIKKGTFSADKWEAYQEREFYEAIDYERFKWSKLINSILFNQIWFKSQFI